MDEAAKLLQSSRLEIMIYGNGKNREENTGRPTYEGYREASVCPAQECIHACLHVELCLRSNAIPIKREYSRESIEPLPTMTHAQHRCFPFIAQRPSHPPQMKYRPSVWVYCVREIVGKDCQ